MNLGAVSVCSDRDASRSLGSDPELSLWLLFPPVTLKSLRKGPLQSDVAIPLTHTRSAMSSHGLANNDWLGSRADKRVSTQPT